MKNLERYQRSPEYLYREVVGEAILVPTGSAGREFSGMATMNPTGAYLWGLLAEPRTLAELAALFAREYDLTAEQSRQDVAEFLEAAQSHGAVAVL